MKDGELEIFDVPFAIAKMVKNNRKTPIRTGPQYTKKYLTGLRKEAKKLGFKVEGKKGPDGNFHIYLVKGQYRRQAL